MGILFVALVFAFFFFALGYMLFTLGLMLFTFVCFAIPLGGFALVENMSLNTVVCSANNYTRRHPVQIVL